MMVRAPSTPETGLVPVAIFLAATWGARFIQIGLFIGLDVALSKAWEWWAEDEVKNDPTKTLTLSESSRAYWLSELDTWMAAAKSLFGSHPAFLTSAGAGVLGAKALVKEPEATLADASFAVKSVSLLFEKLKLQKLTSPPLPAPPGVSTSPGGPPSATPGGAGLSPKPEKADLGLAALLALLGLGLAWGLS